MFNFKINTTNVTVRKQIYVDWYTMRQAYLNFKSYMYVHVSY